MNIVNIRENNIDISVVSIGSVIIKDVSSGLDTIMEISSITRSNRIIINKKAIDEKLFDLSTKILGELLQKFINYNIKIAIVGDFKNYDSKALRDFIYESNKGNDFFFVETEEEARKKISK